MFSRQERDGEARRGSIPAAVCDRGATKPACSWRESPPGGGSFRSSLRCSLLTDRCGYARRSRLGWNKNPSPQAPFQFSDTLLATSDDNENFMNMKKLSRWIAALSILFGCLSVGTISAQNTPKILVVTVTKGFRHSSISTGEKVMADLAQKSRAFTVDYARNDQELAEKMTPAALKNYAAVMFLNTTGDLPLPDKTGFLDWIKTGKAFIGTHSAADTFDHHPGIDPYVDMLGAEFKTHGAQVKVECINQDPGHPATRDLGPSYVVFDEIYQMTNFFRGKVHGLLTLDKHPNTGAPGDYPIAWCKKYGEGNVFYTSLGHREDVWESPTYQQHLLGGIKWALGLEKGDATPQDLAYHVSPAEAAEGFHRLFDGTDLAGWKLRHPDGRASWSAQNGMLVNEVSDTAHGNDLVSEKEFKDFTVRYEYMISSASNSGFYLRGRHEIQILDDFNQGVPTPGGNGAIYNLAPVSKFVSRKPG